MTHEEKLYSLLGFIFPDLLVYIKDILEASADQLTPSPTQPLKYA
jgi:hypothetical protein